MDRPAAKPPSPRRSLLAALAGLALALLVGFVVDGSHGSAMAPHAGAMAGIATLMALWWVLEPVPIAVTSLLPLVLFPAVGLASLGATGANFGKPVIFLFLGGFMLALGLERSGLHRRLALGIVSRVGSQPSRLVLGFMVTTAMLSMWISNTASVMVMMPIGLAVLEQGRESSGTREGAHDVGRLGVALMLGIAYAADMGGMATLVGTPPNLVLVQVLEDGFRAAPAMDFGQWMRMGVPLAVVFVGVGWLLLSKVIFRLPKTPVSGALTSQRDSLGPMSRDELLSGLVFGLAAVLWMTGGSTGKYAGAVTGWRSALGLEQLGDGSVAIFCAVLLFLIPSKERPGQMLMDWETAKRLPWGVLLLFGGGFAMAMGFGSSGLSGLIGEGLGGLQGISPVLVILIVCAVLTLMTELTSNTATTTLILPILATAAPVLGMDPRALMIPAALSASCAFMMPVASPTQAIVYGSGYVPIKEMVRAGIWFNVLGVLLVTLTFWLFGESVFGISLDTVPDWALGP